ncbi:hypothetical protein, partial [Nocardia abscessus]|uniref:hypothetical protein n=1 Tax=Nocardia abscessus TaxID=120957 RepID=UPI002453CEB2
MTVRDVLDYFAKCPDCGYPAQASATVRELRDGRVETEVRPSCGVEGRGRRQRHVSHNGTRDRALARITGLEREIEALLARGGDTDRVELAAALRAATDRYE